MADYPWDEDDKKQWWYREVHALTENRDSLEKEVNRLWELLFTERAKIEELLRISSRVGLIQGLREGAETLKDMADMLESKDKDKDE